MNRVVVYQLIFPLLLGLAAPWAQADDPQALLSRMQQAASSLDYDGIFVYQHGDRLEGLRIVHKAQGGTMRERLVSLNGAPREIIRTEHEVRCYLPDENAVMIEHRRADTRNFPALLPDSLSMLEKNYQIRFGGSGRVAGRKVVSALVTPRDGYRYGYHLWADRITGLLLKASLIDDQGGVIEQYMFTQVSIGKPISESDLTPHHPSRALVTQRIGASMAASTERWSATKLPAGYVLSARMMRKLPPRQQTVEHLVYTDGLAVVSVFIEAVENDAHSEALSGFAHMGAVHAYGKVIEGHQITVLGEAPAMTVDMIGASVAPHP